MIIKREWTFLEQTRTVGRKERRGKVGCADLFLSFIGMELLHRNDFSVTAIVKAGAVLFAAWNFTSDRLGFKYGTVLCIQHGGKVFSVTAETDSFVNFAPTEGGGRGDGSHRKRGKWGCPPQKEEEVRIPPQKEGEVEMGPQKEEEVGIGLTEGGGSGD